MADHGGANSMPYVFSNYPAVNLANNQSIRDVLYPPGGSGGLSPAQMMLGLAGLFGAGGSAGGAGGGGAGGGGGYWWAPSNYNAGYAGAPVGQPLSALLDQQPASFWNGIVDKQNLGLGRINFPGSPYANNAGGSGSYG